MPLDKQLLQKARKSHGEEKIILSLEARGFCVSLLKDGSTVEHEARDAGELPALIKDSQVSWVDYTADDLQEGARKVAAALGFSEQMLATLLKSKRSGYEDMDTEMGFLIPSIIVSGFDVRIEYLLILLRNDLVATIHTTEVKRFFRLRRYAKIYMKKIRPALSSKDKVTTVLIRVLDENNSRNFDHLREIEENSDQVSEKLSKVETPRDEIGHDIHAMKHALISYLSGLWETVDVLNALRYGDPELLTDDPKLLQRLNGLVVEVNYQIGLAEHLSDVLASGLEVMQSIYNNQLQVLNNKLAYIVAYLTIIGTAVLVPNTIATALSNPAYDLKPADAGWYTAMLVLSTILATFLAYWWVKSTGMLPKKADSQD
ncbi:MAG: CorA family divalent cation transporter [Candidatus ainarchaeum sp.]|nr:CorA family divalent cation transporter [Candidatus ainarchaeum sp.]